MKIFIDSADLDEIKQAYAWGIVDGVTTNPSLLKKAVEKRKKEGQKINLKKYISQICRVAKGSPVSLEVTELDAEGMIKQAITLYKTFNKVAKNVCIKVPINPAFKDDDQTHFDGIKVIKTLTKLKIRTNATLIFTPEQALLAAKAGATYISPFVGRVDDDLRSKAKLKFNKTDHYPVWGKCNKDKLIHDNGIVSGIDLVESCIRIFKNYNIKTKVLAASLRNTRQVREAAIVGSDIATLPLFVIQDMLKHYQTYDGMKGFTKDKIEEYEELLR